MSRLKREFTELGVDMTGTEDAGFANADRRRSRSASRPPLKKARAGEDGVVRSSSRAVPRDQSGVRDGEQAGKIRRAEKKMQKKTFARMGKSGESDRHIAVKKPAHLYRGKRGIGKTDRR